MGRSGANPTAVGWFVSNPDSRRDQGLVMRRREFLCAAPAATLSAAALSSVAAADDDADKRRFTMAFAPHFGMFAESAGADLVDQLRFARQRGIDVFGETCPPYLFFTAEHLSRPDGAKWICSPTICGSNTPAESNSRRSKSAMWEG